ncbi:hypothetical protein ANN_08440 [Periplaneta americana]|uniref:Dedicator of cytokinesis N-terminal domain-containing protein n=1 Tax=Periplaneta americana TaxID=6978 RepID=A0ABQ8T2K7_PERAM|nr:hypothetical protein ANN_08440 [Periplaneta americana]
MVDPDTMSVVELYHVHVQSAENSQGASARGTMKRKEARKILTHHLYFCMRDFGHHIGEDTEIYFSLYDTKKAKYISERFLVRISKEGFSNYVEKLHSNCTIFTEEEKELVRSLAETEGCTGRNDGIRVQGRRRYQMIDDIKIHGSYEEIKRKTENRKDWRKLGLQ